jgi:hypothetical protein
MLFTFNGDLTMFGSKKKGKDDPIVLTVGNHEVAAVIQERGEPLRVKPHGGDQTVLYYGGEESEERDGSGLNTPADLLARESRNGLMVPDTMAQTMAQGLRDNERRNTEEGRPMNQPRSRAYLESVKITEERLAREGQATNTATTAEPTSVPVQTSDEQVLAQDTALEDVKDQIKPLGDSKFEVSDTLGNVVDTVEGIHKAIELARRSKV